MPSTEAWARCTTEKASLMKMSPSAASCATKAGSLRSSPGWKRVFSRHRMSPGFMAFTATGDRSLEDRRDRRHEQLERLRRIGSFRAPEMGEQDHLTALVGNLADGRSHALDAVHVGDLTVLDRHVEIDAHEHALAPHVGLIERVEHVSAHCSRVRSACPSQPRLKPHSLSYLDITRTSPTETDDLDFVLAAAVGDGFYDRVEAWDVAATSEDANSLFHHGNPLIGLSRTCSTRLAGQFRKCLRCIPFHVFVAFDVMG